MTNDNIGIPHAILQVIEQFVAVMREDPEIPDHAIGRLEALLRKGAVPKHDDVQAALFGQPEDGER